MANKGCCIEWEQEVILFLDNELPESGRQRVQKHLRQCKYCSSLYHEMERETQLIGGRLRHMADSNLPSRAFTDTVMESIPSPGVATVPSTLKEWARISYEGFFKPAQVHLAVAASLLICIAGIIAVFEMDVEPMDSFIKIKQNGTVRETRLREPITVKSEQGEFFELPDRSLAYATKGTIFYIDSYQQGSSSERVGSDRSLHLLTGELFFDVQPANEGFNVICPNSRTTVVGTKFYVGTQHGQRRKTIVAVLEGQVYVEKTTKNHRGSTVLNKKQMTHVDREDGVVTLQPPSEIWATILNRLNAFENGCLSLTANEILAQPGFHIPEDKMPLPLVQE